MPVTRVTQVAYRFLVQHTPLLMKISQHYWSTLEICRKPH